MHVLDIDFRTSPGAALRAALAERHGDAMAGAALRPRRLFLLRAPWAPGLRFVGGQADCPPLPAFSLAGSGEQLEDALAACIGEGVERLSQVERPGDVAAECPPDQDVAENLPAATGVIEALLGGARDTRIAWARGRTLAADRETLVPADWCLRRHAPGPLAIPGAAPSTGCAAGASYAAAATRALLELAERDAASLWWDGGKRPLPLAADSPAAAEAARLLTALRQDSHRRATWLIDITSDLGIPCLAALSVDDDGRGLACGLAARLAPEAAARAAILEMCQMELALVIAAAKREQGGDGALNDADRRHLARAAALDAGTCELLHPLGAPRRHRAPSGDDDVGRLAALRAAFAGRGIDAVLVDLSRPDFGIPVVHAVAPALQLLPCDMQTERLRRTIAATGGGARWTGGIRLH